MNTKATLKKLHETFPDFDLDILFRILDCYVEESKLSSPSTIPWNGPLTGPITAPAPKPWDNIIYCSDAAANTPIKVDYNRMHYTT